MDILAYYKIKAYSLWLVGTLLRYHKENNGLNKDYSCQSWLKDDWEGKPEDVSIKILMNFWGIYIN